MFRANTLPLPVSPASLPDLPSSLAKPKPIAPLKPPLYPDTASNISVNLPALPELATSGVA
jgi:hypothetical protein